MIRLTLFPEGNTFYAKASAIVGIREDKPDGRCTIYLSSGDDANVEESARVVLDAVVASGAIK